MNTSIGRILDILAWGVVIGFLLAAVALAAYAVSALIVLHPKLGWGVAAIVAFWAAIARVIWRL